MTREKVKFTKRLSVRLAALSTALAMGGGPIAWMQFAPDRATASVEKPDQDGEKPDPVKPIPLPLEEQGQEASPTEMPLSPPAEPVGGYYVDDLQSPTPTHQDDIALAGYNMPTDEQPIVRGNDDGSPAGGPEDVEIRFGGVPVDPTQPKSGGSLVIEPGRTTQFAPPSADSPATSFSGGPATASVGAPAELGAGAAASDLAAPAPSFDPPAYYSPAPQSPVAPSPADYPNELRAPAGGAPAPVFDSPQSYAVQDDEPRQLLPPATAGQASLPEAPNQNGYGLQSSPDFGSPRVANSQPMGSAADSYRPSPNTLPTSPGFGQSSAGTQSGTVGDGMPGPENLDGEQTPTLSLRKVVPQEIQVGKQTTFELHVRNIGPVAAHDVVVVDRIPKGTRFVNATPQFTEAPGGQLMWQIGTLQPGDETVVSVQLLPIAEGEIGSVAHVVFQGQASASTICTKPQLTVTHSGPQKVMIGDNVSLEIVVSNTGTGAATGVVLEEDVPVGLTHAKGNELEFELGTLRPGETQRLPLTLTADKPGIIENTVLVRGDGNLVAESTVVLEVIAPDLQVDLRGPRMRFLDREATYEVVIANPGTAAAKEIELVTYLPKGMKFVSAGNKGHYEPQNHAVYWSLEELPANQSGAAKLTLMPIETGPQKLAVEGRAEQGLQNRAEKMVQVDGSAELEFTVADDSDPIEVGSETTYVITLANSGSSPANDIQLAVALPPELKPIGGEGPTRVVIEGGRVAIDPLARIAPGESAVYRLKVQAREDGAAAGGVKLATVQVQLMTRETPIPIGKQEVTKIYSDQ